MNVLSWRRISDVPPDVSSTTSHAKIARACLSEWQGSFLPCICKVPSTISHPADQPRILVTRASVYWIASHSRPKPMSTALCQIDSDVNPTICSNHSSSTIMIANLELVHHGLTGMITSCYTFKNPNCARAVPKLDIKDSPCPETALYTKS